MKSENGRAVTAEENTKREHKRNVKRRKSKYTMKKNEMEFE